MLLPSQCLEVLHVARLLLSKWKSFLILALQQFLDFSISGVEEELLAPQIVMRVVAA